MEETILEGNKLIAVFTGVKIVKRNDEDAVFMFENAAYPEYFRCTKFNEFHSDWNMLKVAIDKLRSILPRFVFVQNNHATIIRGSNGTKSFDFQNEGTDCATAFKTFVQSVQWYNQQTK